MSAYHDFVNPTADSQFETGVVGIIPSATWALSSVTLSQLAAIGNFHALRSSYQNFETWQDMIMSGASRALVPTQNNQPGGRGMFTPYLCNVALYMRNLAEEPNLPVLVSAYAPFLLNARGEKQKTSAPQQQLVAVARGSDTREIEAFGNSVRTSRVTGLFRR
jgi:hypothetical protein